MSVEQKTDSLLALSEHEAREFRRARSRALRSLNAQRWVSEAREFRRARCHALRSLNAQAPVVQANLLSSFTSFLMPLNQSNLDTIDSKV